MRPRAQVQSCRDSLFQMASFLAATAQWRLAALPIASCGLKLDKEAARVAVGLRLGLDLCVPTFAERQCGSPVDARGLVSIVCKQIVQTLHSE